MPLHFNPLSILLACFVGCITGQLITLPLLPSVDPFYQPPSGFETLTPGEILRSRKVATSYFGLLPNPVQAWQLLYRTTAIDGTAIATVTTVFKPFNAKRDRFVSFHTAYDGAARSGVCDPSYSYQLLSPQVGLVASLEFLLLQAFLLDGNIVSSPDYEGPDAAYGAGRLAGTAALDSMRAIGNFKSTLDFSSDTPQIVGYGYSGGAIATGWAASLQPSYAPELVIKGWVQGGSPANLTGTTAFIDGTLFAGFVPQALAGLTAPTAYGASLTPVLEDVLTPYGKNVLRTAEQICGAQNTGTFVFQSVQGVTFQSLGDRILYDATVSGVLEHNIMGQSESESPTAPAYMFHAPQDEVIPYENATTLYRNWCNFGTSVHFVTVVEGGHITTEVIGFPGAFDFVRTAFAGTVENRCSDERVLEDSLDPLSLGVSFEPILVELLNTIAIAGKKDASVLSDVGTLTKTTMQM